MKTRVVSAAIAVVLLVGVFYIWGNNGLYLICSLAALGGIYEYTRLTFSNIATDAGDAGGEIAGAPFHLRFAFFLLTVGLFFTTLVRPEVSVYFAGMAAIIFLTMALMTVRKAEDLSPALQFQNAGLMGFFYCGIFPATAVSLIALEKGSLWLFGLLAVVFSGDTFAFLSGRLFGKAKLLEPVSPKKTIAGAIGGLLGSAVAGAAMGFAFFPEFSVAALVAMALVSGLFAQAGDLFESLLKRLADVKDSGSIMPGHGGFLDRIDGVLFAAPVYYVLARLLSGSGA